MTTSEIFPKPGLDNKSPELRFWDEPDIAPIVLRVRQAHDADTPTQNVIVPGVRQAIELAGISNLHAAYFKKIDANENFRL